jgi:Ca2+-binding RTX toxin-like protein
MGNFTDSIAMTVGASDASGLEAWTAGHALACGCPACMKAAMLTAMATGTGSANAALSPTALLTDDVAGDRTTTATLPVDGSHLFSTVNTIGDQDFFKVQLVAGQTYEFGMYSATGGPSGVPLADAFLELYDANGQPLAVADGGASTALNSVNSGFDALLTFTVTTSGTYYINAHAFDQDSTNGTGGDGVGDYELFARTADPRTAYHPLYPLDSPLNSIDWGTQVDRTSRNPDGDNGPRDNGAPFYGTVHNDTYGVTGKNVVTYYFAKAGDVFVDDNPATVGSTETIVAKGMADWEKAAFRQVFDLYSQVADVVYIEVQNRSEADFKLITYNGTPGAGASLLGRMSPPGEENEGQAEFNSGDVRWTQEGLTQGGFYFPTLIHELGHGHGMAHPHDNGGHSSVMRGTDDGSVIGGGLGDYDLNQQIFTVMSYNDGWATSPYGQPSSGDATGLNADNFGWMGSLGALDIAVIQDKYGVNEDWAKGDDVYVIKDVNAIGTFYASIWDAGGTDEIRYAGARDANIDLRAASLKYEAGGGGWVSYATGVYGGFTIANGVTIENATSGAGNDTLTGNAAANVMKPGAGNDLVDGGAGSDTVDYSNIVGGVTVDLALAGAQQTGAGGLDTLVSIENAKGSDTFADSLFGNAAANALDGGGGADNLSGRDGDDLLIGGAGADRLDGGAGFDTASYRTATAAVTIAVGNAGGNAGDAAGDIFTGIEAFELSKYGDAFTGSAAAEVVHGGAGADTLSGGDGADKLWGDGGDDQLTGGAGADQFCFAAGFGHDVVTDYRDGTDKIGFFGVAGLDDFTDLTVTSQLRGGTPGALISFGGADIWLRQVSAAVLHADDFLFG